jgi:hypothetical protein
LEEAAFNGSLFYFNMIYLEVKSPRCQVYILSLNIFYGCIFLNSKLLLVGKIIFVSIQYKDTGKIKIDTFYISIKNTSVIELLLVKVYTAFAIQCVLTFGFYYSCILKMLARRIETQNIFTTLTRNIPGIFSEE